MTPASCRPSIHQRADDISDSCQAVEALLPCGRNLVSILVVEPFAVFSPEHRETVEGSKQRYIVAFHDDGHGDKKGPHGSALVHLEALDETDAVFLGCGLHSTGIEGFVVNVDIFEMLEVLLGVLNAKVSLLFSPFGSHDASTTNSTLKTEVPAQTGEIMVLAAAFSLARDRAFVQH